MGVIVITGGSRGIGASTARECAKRGLGVILTYNQNPAAADAVVQGIVETGGRATALPLDVADASSFGEFRDTVEGELNRTWKRRTPSGLVNNAGHCVFSPTEAVTVQQFDRLFDVHLSAQSIEVSGGYVI